MRETAANEREEPRRNILNTRLLSCMQIFSPCVCVLAMLSEKSKTAT